MPNLSRLSLLAALAWLPLSGCVVKVPSTVSTTVAPTYASSSLDQLKLQIERPSTGVRVASTTERSWHRLRLQVGRLDGSMPVLTKTVDPSDNGAIRQAFGNLAPGDGYFIQVSLIHLTPTGQEWEIARGQLGGNGQSVRLNPGPNAVPMPVKAMVTGSYIDAEPTRWRRASTRSTSMGATSVIIINNGPIIQSPTQAPILDDPMLPAEGDYGLGEDYGTDVYGGDYDSGGSYGDDDYESTDEPADNGSDSSDSDSSGDSEDEDLGDWSDVSSAYKL